MADPGQIFSKASIQHGVVIDTWRNIEVPSNVSILTALTIYSFKNVTGGSSHRKELARAVDNLVKQERVKLERYGNFLDNGVKNCHSETLWDAQLLSHKTE